MIDLLSDSTTAAISVSIQVSLVSTLLAVVPGVWIGLQLGLRVFKGREIIVTALYTALAFPTVVIGLFVFTLISHSGPLGQLGLMYTKTAIVAGQFILIIPIIATFTLSSIRKIDPAIVMTAKSMGATGYKLYLSIIKEAKYGIIAAIVAAFGRAISEVGISMILGGNISGFTRTMTTMIALEHDKGEFTQAILLGLILLVISMGINIGFHLIQHRTEENHA